MPSLGLSYPLKSSEHNKTPPGPPTANKRHEREHAEALRLEARRSADEANDNNENQKMFADVFRIVEFLNSRDVFSVYFKYLICQYFKDFTVFASAGLERFF